MAFHRPLAWVIGLVEQGEIGKLWASFTDEEMLERFWQAVKDGSRSISRCSCWTHGTG
jgi:hypothetical protein